MLNYFSSITKFYYNTVISIKTKIKDYFENKPEKDLVENNIFLLGEHILFTFLGFSFFANETWLWDISMMWEYGLDLSISIYYFLYTARYFVQIQMMTGEEKDYQSLMTHHISTLLLLVLSFLHYHRIGVIIALSHDVGDLFFLPAKLFHKFYETRRIYILNILSYIYFIFFVFIFFATRIYLNSKIIYHIIDYIFFDNIYNIYLEGWVLFVLLFVNLGIQIFWQIMIIKFAYNLSLDGKPKDEKGNEYFKKD